MQRKSTQVDRGIILFLIFRDFDYLLYNSSIGSTTYNQGVFEQN